MSQENPNYTFGKHHIFGSESGLTTFVQMFWPHVTSKERKRVGQEAHCCGWSGSGPVRMPKRGGP